MLTLTVLGCDGSHAGAGGAASGYLVRSWGSATSVWVDAGPGTFANLQRFTDPGALSAVVLTHSHADHYLDIEAYITAARWVHRYRRDPLPVYAAPGILPALTQETEGVLDWREVGDGDGAEVGGVRLGFRRTDHSPVTLGVRLSGEGRALGYSADSGPGWSLSALGPDLDLALCEATYTAEYEGTAGHMSGREAGNNAREAGARRLVLTHRWPTIAAAAVHAEATVAFGGGVEQAAVGRGYSL
ncbi:MAG TPA: MBL fold metallo-hydrolase [Acidimicrobiales bacterium]|nr:MBL fold metallo-hydrolase [Acidimicrobiales bacterium]